MGAATVVQLGELMMILDLHRQGLSVTAIARRTGRDPKTIRKYIARGLELPVYGPRQVGRPNKLAPYLDYLRERIAAFPDLSAVRLTRELRERGYLGAYTAVKRFVAAIRPSEGPKAFEVRFETPAGHQAQVDFARFVVTFEDAPGMTRIIWLFSLVLGHSRHIVARFVLHQDLQTLLRCHMRAFEAIGGVPIEILYDRMKTAVTGEDDEGHIVYNRSLIALAKHFGFLPRACRPYRAKTKGKVERPFSYIRQDFFLGRSFRNLDDLNRQLAGSTRSPTSACMARRSGSCRRPSRPRSPTSSRCRQHPSTHSSSSNGASAMTGSSRLAATTTAFPIGPAASSRCINFPTSSASSTAAVSWRPIRSWRADGNIGSTRLIVRVARLAPCATVTSAASSSAAGAITSPGARSPSIRPSESISQAGSEVAHDPRLRHNDRQHQAQPRRAQDAPRTRSARYHPAAHRAGRDRRHRRPRPDPDRGTHLAREPPRQDSAPDGAPHRDQNTPGLRLRLPALARSQPRPGAGRAQVHRPRRGGASSRTARHRQKPPCHGLGRRGREGRPQRRVLDARRSHRIGTLHERIRYLSRASLLVVDEIGYLPVVPGGGNLFFQLVNARYEKSAMILTSNRGFAEWGEVFGDPVVATALLDRLLHHAVVIQIEGSSYRLRQHAELMPEHVRSKALITPPDPAPVLRRRGRPPKNGPM